MAIMNPDKEFHMVESDQKKCTFMRTVSRETRAENATIHNSRIETVSRETKPDLIMARALASLNKLLEYSSDWIGMNPDLRLLFPKGERYEEEIQEAKQCWNFSFEEVESVTGGQSSILILSNVSSK